MKTLVFDTCFNQSYIAFKENDKILESEIIQSTDSNYHSVFIIPKIVEILKKHNLKINDIDVIGVNIGPGSFTGIRAGITIARVLAQQANIKLIGVNSLQILSKLNNSNENTIVALDARKNKVYFAMYSKNTELIKPQLIERGELLNKIDKSFKIIADSSISNFLYENKINSKNYEESQQNLGLYLLNIVEDKLFNHKNDNFNWAEVKPLYIQPPSITKPKELKNV